MNEVAIAKFAAIDIGSNSITLLIASQTISKIDFVTHYKNVVITGLAAKISKQGVLNPTALKLIFETINNFYELCLNFNIPPNKIKAVATAAARQCFKEAETFFSMLAAKLNIHVKIITPKSEMLLSRRALDLMQISSQNIIYFDLGGASTEIGHHENAAQMISIPFGALMIQSLLSNNSFSPKIIHPYLKQCADFVHDATALCTYGSINLIFQMMSNETKLTEISQHGSIRNSSEVIIFLNEMIQKNLSPQQFLSEYPFLGLRGHSILGDIILFKEFLVVCKPKEVVCSSYGLVEGLVFFDVNDLEQFALVE